MASLLTPLEATLFVHIAAGLGALAAATIVTIRRPKGGEFHKKAGRWFLWLVLVVALTAGLLLIVRPNPFFFALSVFSFYLAFSGWRVLRRKSSHADPHQRAWLIDWLAALVTVAVGVASVFWYQDGRFGAASGQAAVVLDTLAFAAVAALYDLWRFAAPTAIARVSFVPAGNVWLLEHITKLSGAYIALACAFSGTVLSGERLLPAAIAQTLPAVIGTPILLYVANRYWRTMNTRRGKV